MITKEQAMTKTNFREVQEVSINPPLNTCKKQRKWRANGKCKTWITRPMEFRLPVKSGLNQYAYIDHTNCHLVELDE